MIRSLLSTLVLLTAVGPWLADSASATPLNTYQGIEDPVVGEAFPWSEAIAVGRGELAPQGGA